MDLSLTEEQLMIQKAAREFAQQQCLPGVIERDEHQKVPKEQLLQLADLGFMGIMTPAEYGGAGMDTISYVLAMEEISKVDSSVSVSVIAVATVLIDAASWPPESKNLNRARWREASDCSRSLCLFSSLDSYSSGSVYEFLITRSRSIGS